MRLLPATLVVLIAAIPVASAQKLPPVAAPTAAVSVGSLPVVRSNSQEVSDYATGLVAGLMSAERVPALALAIVHGDHVVVGAGFGRFPGTAAAVGADTVFGTDGLGEVIASIAMMQMVEQGHLLPDADLGETFGEGALTGITAAQLLTHRAHADSGALGRVVAAASGERFPAYVKAHIFAPLMMANSRIGPDGSFHSSAADMGRLMLALVNGGAIGDARILQPETVDLMERTQAPGKGDYGAWSFGFAVRMREGWRTLQRDGEGGVWSARFVLIPEAQIAYFIAARDAHAHRFWRALDASLFARMFGPHPAAKDAPLAPAPDEKAAEAASGDYLPLRDENWLGLKRGVIAVRAHADGALAFSGAMRGLLTPRRGGGWRDTIVGIDASHVGGQLFVNGAPYGRVPLWHRPAVLAGPAVLLALLAGAGGGWWAWRRTGARGRARKIGVTVFVLCLAFLGAAVLVGRMLALI